MCILESHFHIVWLFPHERPCFNEWRNLRPFYITDAYTRVNTVSVFHSHVDYSFHVETNQQVLFVKCIKHVQYCLLSQLHLTFISYMWIWACGNVTKNKKPLKKMFLECPFQKKFNVWQANYSFATKKDTNHKFLSFSGRLVNMWIWP